ncbi:CRISPR/Cas system-associated exonuclease Cas4 (RecB family) [Rhodopseudomonas rhenobacensis]|uniref:CRISPR/Cas system-associated exonuclease Cas4 (RecB family) n=1 Tax=Rhodopseudomonas rhenobacensis TaxID=87461 RepID=A0A7W8DYL5_9BRAD|nr:hypothetical protein [Rhodopseudomonas rhenobacensis]MBB5047058.1 CRISPR/Cas system-associated exonuclease Cas4 (RecB family) [Rhodopseudomonas rhenobacensis]
MADADLDVIIRQLAKQQSKTLTAATKTRRDRYLGLAAEAKDAAAKARFKALAKEAFEQGSAAAKRLQTSADNAADSYSRAMRKATEAAAAQPAAKTAAPVKKTPAKTPAADKPAKQAASANKPGKATKKPAKKR